MVVRVIGSDSGVGRGFVFVRFGVGLCQSQ